MRIHTNHSHSRGMLEKISMSISFTEIPTLSYYENLPMQYIEKKLVVKMKIFIGKYLIFSYFCSKHRLWVPTIYVLEQK